MRVMLTSFGIGGDENTCAKESLFHRMPPVSMRGDVRTFLPDYPALVVCKKLVVDGETYDRLQRGTRHSYRLVSETLQALRAEGFVELVEYENILEQNRELLERMLTHDLRVLDFWVKPLGESLSIWEGFWKRVACMLPRNESKSAQGGSAGTSSHAGLSALPARTRLDSPNGLDSFPGGSTQLLKLREYAAFQRGILKDYASFGTNHMYHEWGEPLRVPACPDSEFTMLQEAVHSSRSRRKKEYREVLRRSLRSYLGYVNANLVVSNELEVAFHDWLDLMPFYRAKFLVVGQSAPRGEARADAASKLFDVSFPEPVMESTSEFMRVVTDHRVESLRDLVDRAVKGELVFDDHFANQTLRDVLGEQKAIQRWRRIVSYGTFPIGFIPWIGTPLEKLAEEAIMAPLEAKLKKKHQWYYLLSDVKDARTE